MTYTVSEENYIKAIFHLQGEEGLVNTNSLSAELLTRPASVTDMLKKLKAKKLVSYERYKGFRLSQEGKKVALGIIRRHRLWEFFLSEKLRFSWDEVHEVAEQLEHVTSVKLIDKLDEYLGFPRLPPTKGSVSMRSLCTRPWRYAMWATNPLKCWISSGTTRSHWEQG